MNMLEGIAGLNGYQSALQRQQSQFNVGLGGTASDVLGAYGTGYTQTGQPYVLTPPPPSPTFVQQNVTVNNVVNNYIAAPNSCPAAGNVQPSSYHAPCDHVQISPMAQFLSQFLSILESMLCGQGAQQHSHGHGQQGSHGHHAGSHGHGSRPHGEAEMHRALLGWG